MTQEHKLTNLTGANIVIVGSVQTQLTTTSVVVAARIDRDRTTNTDCLQAHDIWKLIGNSLSTASILSADPADTVNASPLPVSPIQMVTEKTQTKGMR